MAFGGAFVVIGVALAVGAVALLFARKAQGPAWAGAR
jgi:hypothetical protein